MARRARGWFDGEPSLEAVCLPSNGATSDADEIHANHASTREGVASRHHNRAFGSCVCVASCERISPRGYWIKKSFRFPPPHLPLASTASRFQSACALPLT